MSLHACYDDYDFRAAHLRQDVAGLSTITTQSIMFAVCWQSRDTWIRLLGSTRHTTIALAPALGSGLREFEGDLEIAGHSSQAVTGTLTQDGFGNTVTSTGSSSDPYMYAATSGYRNDGDAGLTHVGARYYDAQVGRFTSRDTDLDEAPYLYCDHDPINNVDPSGHEWREVYPGLGYIVHHDDGTTTTVVTGPTGGGGQTGGGQPGNGSSGSGGRDPGAGKPGASNGPTYGDPRHGVSGRINHGRNGNVNGGSITYNGPGYSIQLQGNTDTGASVIVGGHF